MAKEVDLEQRFIEALKHHLSGWTAKVEADFNEQSFNTELRALEGDPVYRNFCFANAEYVLIRLMGRMSISIGRRLGEIYDKLPRLAVQARFNLSHEDVAPKFDGLELDIRIPVNKLSEADKKHLDGTISKYGLTTDLNGIGIEIRYNFNPNDSARLRKDDKMAEHLVNHKLTPIYLIFSGISPRDEAIARLKRSGWNFLIGEEASSFMIDLTGMDITSILEKPTIQQALAKEVKDIMRKIFTSYAFREASRGYNE